MVSVLLIISVVALLPWIAALLSIKDFPHGSATSLTLWTLIVTVFPIIGSIMWFAVGKSILKKRP